MYIHTQYTLYTMYTCTLHVHIMKQYGNIPSSQAWYSCVKSIGYGVMADIRDDPLLRRESLFSL